VTVLYLREIGREGCSLAQIHKVRIFVLRIPEYLVISFSSFTLFDTDLFGIVSISEPINISILIMTMALFKVIFGQ